MTWARALGSLLTRPTRPPIDAFERSLIDAVIATPADDAPRLVYADWLCARPEPTLAARGELIVVQCSLAGLVDPAEHNRLKARDFDLLDKLGSTWCAYAGLGEVRNNFYESEVEADFQRGFIETVVMPLARFPGVIVPLFTNEVPRHLVLTGSGREVIKRMGDSVFMRRIESLALRRNWLNGSLPPLMSAENLANLERLEISDCELGVTDIAALARSTALGKLRELVLPRNNLGAAAAVELGQSRLAAQLEVVELTGNPIGDEGAAAFEEWPKLRRLALDADSLSTSVRARLQARFALS